MADTKHLTLEEHGASILLLMIAWRDPDCSLPNCDTFLARSLGIKRDRWLRIKPTVMASWELCDDARYRQKRLSAEKERVKTSRAKKSYAGTASALKRKEKRSTHVGTAAQQISSIQNQSQNQKSNYGLPISSAPLISFPESQLPPLWRKFGETFNLTIEQLDYEFLVFKETIRLPSDADGSSWFIEWQNWLSNSPANKGKKDIGAVS